MPRNNHSKFDSNPFSSFREEDFLRIANDGRRRTPSDGNSSPGLGLWPGELKSLKNKSVAIFLITVKDWS